MSDYHHFKSMDQPSSTYQFLSAYAKWFREFVPIAVTLSSAIAAIGAKTWSDHARQKREKKAEQVALEIMSANWSDSKKGVILEIANSDQSTDSNLEVQRYNTRDHAYVRPPKSPIQIARERVIFRITEAISTRTEQLNSAKRFKAVAMGLTCTNFILGGILASSFVQTSVSPKWAGGLGLLVLIASLIQQKYHPEIDADAASQKAAQLLSLIRSSEDRLTVLDAKIVSGEDSALDMIGLMESLTRRLGEIETLQLVQPKADNEHDKQK